MEKVAGDEGVVSVRVFGSGGALPLAPIVGSSPGPCQSYDTPLPWLKAACNVT